MYYTQKLKPSRFGFYHKSLLHYDNTDKNPTKNLPNLNSFIKVYFELSLLTSKKSYLDSAITLEILSQQRFLFSCGKKKKLIEAFYLISTLRKNKLLTFLDLCLNIGILEKTIFLNYNNTNQELFVLFNSEVVDNLTLTVNIAPKVQMSSYCERHYSPFLV